MRKVRLIVRLLQRLRCTFGALDGYYLLDAHWASVARIFDSGSVIRDLDLVVILRLVIPTWKRWALEVDVV